MIDVREILAGDRPGAAHVTLAVTVVGTLVLVSGILILVGSISMTKFQRIYEAAILKTLGATTRPRRRHAGRSNTACSGLVAGAIGAVGARRRSRGRVSRLVLDLPVAPAARHARGGPVGLASALVAAVGVLASLDVLRRNPLATLRAE